MNSKEKWADLASRLKTANEDEIIKALQIAFEDGYNEACRYIKYDDDKDVDAFLKRFKEYYVRVRPYLK